MKGLPFILGAALVLGGAHGSGAQTTSDIRTFELPGGTTQPAVPHRRLARGDVSGILGWFTANRDEFDSSNDWVGDSVFGGASFGWYWTDHLKTEVQFGRTSEVRLYTATPLQIGNTRIFAPSTYTFSTRRLTLGQLYQFGRNEWFHPYAGGGVDVVWDRQQRSDEYVYYFDPVTRQGQVLRERAERGATTDIDPRAFLSAGFKAYMSRRSFFLLDSRLTFADRPEEVLVRIGFGVDF